MDLWLTSQQHKESPLFSGGLLDAWPAFAVDAINICRTEVGNIQNFLNRDRHV